VGSAAVHGELLKFGIDIDGYAERLIGSIRRECLDHVVVFGERHLRRILLSYVKYYNEVRTHPSLEKDTRSRAPSNGPDAFFVAQFSAGYTINMFGFDLRQGQA
jgi:transposase InsO family protein